MRRTAIIATLLWAALVAAAVMVIAGARYTSDLSAFLPSTPTPAQQLLVDQLREGVASQLIIVAIEGGDAATRGLTSRELAAVLRTDARFTSINNGEASAIERDRQILFDNRYLLGAAVRPERFTAAGLRAAIQETLDRLASPARHAHRSSGRRG